MTFKLTNLAHTSFTFEGKRSYEEVALLLYRHWLILVEQLLGFLMLALLPFILYLFAYSYVHAMGLVSLWWFLVSLYFLFWWYGLFYAVTMYLLDMWIVTDHRVIDSEQHGFFNRSVSELSLSKIQDISVATRGAVATFFDFGDVEIQTAGTKEKFLFKQIPHPQAVKDQIMEAHNEFIKQHRGGSEIHDESSL